MISRTKAFCLEISKPNVSHECKGPQRVPRSSATDCPLENWLLNNYYETKPFSLNFLSVHDNIPLPPLLPPPLLEPTRNAPTKSFFQHSARGWDAGSQGVDEGLGMRTEPRYIRRQTGRRVGAEGWEARGGHGGGISREVGMGVVYRGRWACGWGKEGVWGR